jgi:hypothetical protein
MLFFISEDKPEFEYSGKKGGFYSDKFTGSPGKLFIPEKWHRIFSGQLATVRRRIACCRVWDRCGKLSR